MLTKATFLYHFLKFAKDPEDTQEIFKFHDALLKMSGAETLAEMSARLIADPVAEALYASANPDHLNKPYDLKALSQCPVGSLGQVYAEKMLAAGLDPEFYARHPVQDAATFFSMRLRKTHDLYHILTGFDTSVAEEIGLQGFYLGQFQSSLNLSIVSSVFVTVIQRKDNDLMAKTLEDFVLGYLAGASAVKLYGVVWEDYWDTDLNALRAKFNIKTRLEMSGVAA